MALKTSTWDPAEHLITPEEREEFLNAALHDEDEAYFQHALCVAARTEDIDVKPASQALQTSVR